MSSSQNNEYAGNSEDSLNNKLYSALDKTCERFISSLKFSRMKNTYKPIYKKHPDVLRNINEQLCSQIKNSIKEELDQITKECSIDELLNSLEAIKKDQDPSQPSWRPSGNPEEDLRDHLHPLKAKHKESLQAMLYRLQAENETYTNTVVVNHGKIIHSKQSIEDLHEQLSDVVTSFTSNMKCLQRTMGNMIDQE